MSFYSGFAAYYEKIFPFREEVYLFLEKYAGGSGGKLLDAGCGPGHYCGRFALDGYQAVGVDLDAEMIRAAKSTYPQAMFHCLDIRELFSLGTGFSCIYSIGNVLSHLTSHDLGIFIGNVYDMLEPGGFWIMQVVNWDVIICMDHYDFPPKVIEGDNGSLVFQRSYSAIRRDAVEFNVSLQSGKQTFFIETVSLYPIISGDCVCLHEQAGFRVSGKFADFSAKPYLKDSGSGMVLVFDKS
jgi:SAM-dependent methyltransferase